MRLKAVLLALAIGAVTAAGAAAKGGPGPGGGHPGPPPAKTSTESDDHPENTAKNAFRTELTALGFTCARQPVLVRGALTAIGTDTLTVHSLRPAEHGRKATPADVVVKMISKTQIHRSGHAGPAALTDLVVKDVVEVHAAACRTAAATTGTPPTLVAGMVNAHPARAAH